MNINIQLGPVIKYLHQIRKIEDYLIFDMYFPSTWKILKKFVIEDKFVNLGTIDDGLIGMSFVSESNENSFRLMSCFLKSAINPSTAMIFSIQGNLAYLEFLQENNILEFSSLLHRHSDEVEQ